MNKFIDYVLQFGNLNIQQVELIESKASEFTLRKDEYYWEAGKVVKQIGFITEGVIRVFYYNNKGEEITRYFIDENHLSYRAIPLMKCIFLPNTSQPLQIAI